MLAGAAAGLVIVVPLSSGWAVLDREVSSFDRTAWAPLLALGLFAAYAVAGGAAARRAPGAPLANGMVGAVGTLVAWLPIRVVVWLAREEGRGLFRGTRPVLTVGQLFGQVLFAAAFGFLGALLAARSARRRREPPTPSA